MISDRDRRQRFEAIAEDVFEPLQRYLRRRANRADAEDVLSDVMLTVWRRLDDVPTDAVLPWCYGIARRSLANHRRGQTRHLRLVQRLESQPREIAPVLGVSVNAATLRLGRARSRLAESLARQNPWQAGHEVG